MLFEQKDFDAAYQAYRQAYSFDPTNDIGPNQDAEDARGAGVAN